jgi:hypothetical protein
LGNDDNAPMNKVLGGDMPAAMWRDFVERAGPLVSKPTAAQRTMSVNASRSQTPIAGKQSLRGTPEVLVTRLWNGTLQFDGTWIVEADTTSDQIRDELTPCLSEGDAVLVVGAGIEAAWAGFEPADCDWLVEHF